MKILTFTMCCLILLIMASPIVLAQQNNCHPSCIKVFTTPIGAMHKIKSYDSPFFEPEIAAMAEQLCGGQLVVDKKLFIKSLLCALHIDPKLSSNNDVVEALDNLEGIDLDSAGICD